MNMANGENMLPHPLERFCQQSEGSSVGFRAARLNRNAKYADPAPPPRSQSVFSERERGLNRIGILPRPESRVPTPSPEVSRNWAHDIRQLTDPWCLPGERSEEHT